MYVIYIYIRIVEIMIIIYSGEHIESTYGYGSKPSMVAGWYPDGTRSHSRDLWMVIPAVIW
jgi:hypothetical protein